MNLINLFKSILIFGFIISTIIVSGQDKVTVSGYLSDEASGESLLFGNVFIKSTTTGVNTNEYGFYPLDIPANQPITLIFSFFLISVIKKNLLK